jgi:hypothetical protein
MIMLYVNSKRIYHLQDSMFVLECQGKTDFRKLIKSAKRQSRKITENR